MKKINAEKYDRVKQYILNNLPVLEIREKIQSEFQSSISNETIKKLRDELYECNDNTIDTEILKKLIPAFIEQGIKVNTLSETEIERLTQLITEVMH